KAVERIKSGKSKDTIERIRKEKSKEKRNNLKSKLPAILFAGVFNERNKKGLKKHSGMMVLDFDDFEGDEVYNEIFNKLKYNKYICLAFRSPSGNGIKAVAKIPESDSVMHE